MIYKMSYNGIKNYLVKFKKGILEKQVIMLIQNLNL